ncbi:MAG TPA: peptidoglycan editing factor PgeF [Candidatus Kapabacteria bacterium]|nr:peptidoglycan editing factor PgeF [Candidatus Kapabacteria bacterium]
MIPLVRSSIFHLFPSLVCGISTRQGGVSGDQFGLNMSTSVGDTEQNVAENRWRFCEALGIWPSRFVLQKQVHGDAVSIVDRPGIINANDALVTQTKNIYLGVSFADCQPVLMYDSANHVVAAVHAGWRGAAKHIAVNAFNRMHDTFGTKAEDVFAFVGPAASQCCYEVSAEVASQFDADLSKKTGEGKFMLDLKGSTFRDLRSVGVLTTHIEISPLCTICDKEFFHSYRRDGEHSGRMLAVIGMREE